MSERDEFLAGDRLDDIALFLSESALSGSEKLAEYGERVDGETQRGSESQAVDEPRGGVVLVLDGTKGRNVFSRATGMDAMQFAQRAMGSEGEIDRDLTGTTCPHTDEEGEHETRLVFAFAEGKNEEAGGLYAEGDVIHAYAHCSCGAAYSDRWVTDDDSE